MPRSNHPVAALLALVGPSAEDVSRVADVLDSVERYEPRIGHVVLIDDSRADRPFSLAALGVRRVPITVLRNPRDGRVGPKRGALIAGVLSGLVWLADLPGVEFVLKIDLDALVIAPFVDRIAAFVRTHPDAGVIGCRGETCDPAHPRYLDCLRRPSPFVIALEVLDTVFPEGSAPAAEPVLLRHASLGTTRVTPAQVAALRPLRASLEEAIANGHHCADYCQGGAYAVSSTLIQRMAARGAFDNPTAWLPFPFFGEDQVIAMHSYVAGLRVYDFSGEGEPFGISCHGLPFSPHVLVTRGHALIHSLRGDVYSESDIRKYFAQLRQTHPEVRDARTHSGG